jgi:drug/metabolite transporter (DMT)-like permease
MHIADQTKFLIGVLFAVIGLFILVSSRRTRGFGQRKQAGALLLIAAAVFIAIGLGYDPRALLRQ